MVLGAPDRVNIPCLMHDTRLCQLDVQMTNNYHGTKQWHTCLKENKCEYMKNNSRYLAQNARCKMQSDLLMKCKDIVIMTLRGAKTIFLDT